jgi:D-serine deaminase-like pyridoxal phosphate-dependent protein
MVALCLSAESRALSLAVPLAASLLALARARRRDCRNLTAATTVPLKSVDTPAIVLDLATLKANIQTMQAIATSRGVALRPHIKTHKSLVVAQMQRDAGAVGVTCSKPDEAIVFLRGGFDTLLAYPIVARSKLDRVIAEAIASTSRLCVMVDSAAGVQTAAAAARDSALGAALDTMVKVDGGMHRCGVPPGERLTELCSLVDAEPALSLKGIMTHAGQSYGAVDKAGCAKIADAETALMRGAAADVRSSRGSYFGGLRVSVGSTLTELARNDFEGLHEIRPGNYVFMDGTPLRLGLAGASDVSLTVLATVVSMNEHYAIIDAGSKVLSSDKGAHGTDAFGGHGRCWALDDEQRDTSGGAGTASDRAELLSRGWTVTKLSEEHGWIDQTNLGATQRRLRVGERVRIVPNHSCPVANLADEYVVVGPSGDVVDRWPVDARGGVH